MSSTFSVVTGLLGFLARYFPKIKKPRKSTAKRIVKPKYQNPEDPSQTWSGRGRNPKWVVALIQSGGNIKDCAI